MILRKAPAFRTMNSLSEMAASRPRWRHWTQSTASASQQFGKPTSLALPALCCLPELLLLEPISTSTSSGPVTYSTLPETRKYMAVASAPCVKSSWAVRSERSLMAPWQISMRQSQSASRTWKKRGCGRSTGPKVSHFTCSIRVDGKTLNVRMSSAWTRLLAMNLYARMKAMMRVWRSNEILLSAMKRLILSFSWKRCSWWFRRLVMAVVMLLRNDPNVTSAEKSTIIAKTLSTTFVGVISIDAGVNCVSDQCRQVT
mmetsp:Transcript_38366/g.121950  ORF Transcript_38366/g.121950 Transcript_38366/m.121950 type:complete len:257 (-) Transcript_38366:118-888(-)